jgi:hypothetical protein
MISRMGLGRYTWAANVLLGESSSSVGQWVNRLERTDVVLERLREIGQTACALVPETAPRPVRELAAALPARVDQMERDLHESMVRAVFGDAVPH